MHAAVGSCWASSSQAAGLLPTLLAPALLPEYHNKQQLALLAPLPTAIRFVLDDLFSSLSTEDRRALLHVSRRGRRRWRQPGSLHVGCCCRPHRLLAWG